jgi:hypothetical protein
LLSWATACWACSLVAYSTILNKDDVSHEQLAQGTLIDLPASLQSSAGQRPNPSTQPSIKSEREKKEEKKGPTGEKRNGQPRKRKSLRDEAHLRHSIWKQ